MRILKQEILLAIVGLILNSSNSFAADCTSTPDCGALGYTKTAAECDGVDTLKCPFDTSKVICFSVKEEVVEGAILYGDGTVTPEIIASKKPIGVVFDVTNRLAVALTDIKTDGSVGTQQMRWSSSFCVTPNGEAWDGTLIDNLSNDGRKNTDAILASTCNGTTYAANAVNAYNPSNCSAVFCKQGKWFLPSLGNLFKIGNNKTTINSTLTSLASQGASTMAGSYWSSTEYSGSAGESAYNLDIASNSEIGSPKTSLGSYVRPVIAF